MPIIDNDGSNLYYTVKGKGIPIVLIHPPFITSASFKYQIEELSKNFKVIAFDIRGHGRSPFSEVSITYRLIAKDIKHLLDHLGIEKAYLCGYSTGGSVCLEFLLEYSDRALGAIIVSGMSEICYSYTKKLIIIATMLAKWGAIPLLGLAISWGNSDTMATFRQLYQEGLKGDKHNIEQYFRCSLTYTCTKQLAMINQPILLVYGTKDTTFFQYAKLLHEKLPKSQLELLHQKHQIPTKSAKELNRLIRRFIQSYE